MKPKPKPLHKFVPLIPLNADRPPSPAQEYIRCWYGKPNCTLPKAGERFRHYSGRMVTVIGVAVREESGKIAVIYKEDNDEVWDRLLTVWDELVLYDGKPVRRFQVVPEDPPAKVEPCRSKSGRTSSRKVVGNFSADRSTE